MKTILTSFILCFFMLPTVQAQIPPISKKKATIVHLKDGSTLTGPISKVNYKKGKMTSLLITSKKGTTKLVAAKEISFAEIPINEAWKKINSSPFWGNTNYTPVEVAEMEFIRYESHAEKTKKGTQHYLYCLLNNWEDSKIKVFHDPRANKAPTGYNPYNSATYGGYPLSFYVELSDGQFFKVTSKQYGEQLKVMYADCPELIESITFDLDWEVFDAHISRYHEDCN